jgi:hypothetical protein
MCGPRDLSVNGGCGDPVAEELGRQSANLNRAERENLINGKG